MLSPRRFDAVERAEAVMVHHWQFSDDLRVISANEADGLRIMQVLDYVHELHGIPQLNMPTKIRCQGSGPDFIPGEIRLPLGAAVDVIVHEIGHMIDWALLEDLQSRLPVAEHDIDHEYLSETQYELIEPWLGAVSESLGYQRVALAQMQATDPLDIAHLTYLARIKEMWARAYTQWVLAGADQWAHLVEAYSQELTPGYGADLCHWEEGDFAAISAQMDRMLKSPMFVRERAWQQEQAS